MFRQRDIPADSRHRMPRPRRAISASNNLEQLLFRSLNSIIIEIVPNYVSPIDIIDVAVQDGVRLRKLGKAFSSRGGL